MQLNKTDILKLVKVRKSDVFWSHFFYGLKKDYSVNGEIQTNTIKVWQKASMTGVFYPVYTFEFNSDDQLLKITDSLNSFGKLLQLLFPLFYFHPLFSNSFTHFELRHFFIAIALFLILTFACYLISNAIYQYEKKEQLKDFYETLNIKTGKKSNYKTEEKTEKEWSINKTLTRLFTYPFCFALILANIFLIIPEGNLFVAIPTLGVVGFYLYCDLKIIFKT